MEYTEFLHRIIEEEVASVKKKWFTNRERNKLEGALNALENCRDKAPTELMEIFKENAGYADGAYKRGTGEYMWFEAYQATVKHILDLVSAVLVNEGGKPLMIGLPTAMGVTKATVILNSEQ